MLLASAVVIAIVVAVALAAPFGWYYDHLVRRRTARFLAEKLGHEPYLCSIEIRTDALRVAQAGVELVFPWTSVRAVEDTPQGVLVAFKVGRVLARSRGFTSTEHRQQFLERVREFASRAKVESTP